MGVVTSFKEVAIGLILLIVLAAFAATAAADANITGLSLVVVGFVVPLMGVALLFAVFKGIQSK